MVFQEFLEPIWENLAKDTPKSSLFTGQRISVPDNHITVFVAIDSKKQAHFLISPAPGTIKKLDRFSFRGLSFELRECEISGYGRGRYLDLVCSVFDVGSRRPFAKFCEDVLIELGKNPAVEDAVYKTCFRWKRFWDSPYETSFSEEWLKGLFGELVFVYDCLKKGKTSVVSAWYGPDRESHDFQSNNIAIELKTTATLPAKVQINNIHQMDYTLFKNLWMLLIMVSASNKGESVVSMASKIETALQDTPDILELFWDKLCKTGYRRYFENSYLSYGYTVNEKQWFKVNKDFPKIIPSDFKVALDRRVKSVSYIIELSGMTPVRDQKTIQNNISQLCRV